LRAVLAGWPKLSRAAGATASNPTKKGALRIFEAPEVNKRLWVYWIWMVVVPLDFV
jgi:hypothetical protein